MLNSLINPVVPPAQKAAKKIYERPAFIVIPLNMEAPLLSASESKGGILNNHPIKEA